MASALQRARATARHQRGQRIVIVDIAVAQAASVDQGGVIQQIAVAIRRGLQLVQELREQGQVIILDLDQLGQFLGLS